MSKSLPQVTQIRFLVVIPTIRKATSENIRKNMETFTFPTDLLILEGSEGKAQTLNYALTKHLNPSKHTFYVTLDDDTLLPSSWQDAVVKAYKTIPNLGACGFDLEDTPEMDRYMIQRPPIKEIQGVQYRPTEVNIVGALIIMRSEVAQIIGQTPIRYDTKYQLYEDAWRCRQIRRMGLETVYLIGEEPLKMVQYDDPLHYHQMKAHDAEKSSQKLPFLQKMKEAFEHAW